MTIEYLNKRIDRVEEENNVPFIIGERILLDSIYMAGEITVDQYDALIERLRKIAIKQKQSTEYVTAITAYQRVVFDSAAWVYKEDVQ